MTGLPYQWTRVAHRAYWSKAVFSSAMLVGFGVCSVPVFHLTC